MLNPVFQVMLATGAKALTGGWEGASPTDAGQEEEYPEEGAMMQNVCGLLLLFNILVLPLPPK